MNPSYFVCLLIMLPTGLAAQTSTTDWNTLKALTPAVQVKITSDARTLSGRVARVTDEALEVTTGKGLEAFDRQRISTVSIIKPSQRKRNVLIGLATGTVVGLGIGIAARAKPGQLAVVPNGAIVGAFTVAGALGGSIVGVVIPTGGWREIYKK